jgi:Spy/CpxP family protein refolding chaperone
MRIVRRLAVAVSAVMLLSTPALAQRQGFGGGMGFGGGGGLLLLSNKGVQQELKLDAQQTEKVAKYIEESTARRRDQSKALSKDERKAKAQELAKAANAETQKALKDLLKSEQITRFNQIALQQRGVMAFGDPEILGKLKLTSDQTEQARATVQSFGTESREVFQNNQGNFEEVRKQLDALRKSKMEKVTALLTAEQKATWKELTGEPFEVRFEPPQRRGNQ